MESPQTETRGHLEVMVIPFFSKHGSQVGALDGNSNPNLIDHMLQFMHLITNVSSEKAAEIFVIPVVLCV